MILRLILIATFALAASSASAQERREPCGNGYVAYFNMLNGGPAIAHFVDEFRGVRFQVYGPPLGGTQRIVSIAHCRSGVVTAFSGKGIYYSPDCQFIGGGVGHKTFTERDAHRSHQWEVLGDEVQITFEEGGVYRTSNCKEAGVHCVGGTCLPRR